MKIETPDELLQAKLLCIEQVRRKIDFAKLHLGISISYPQVLFGLKGTTAGTADSQNGVIQLHPTLLIYNPDEFIRQVVPHEVAHLLTRCKWPKAESHGDEWKSIMRGFGLKPDRCHSMNTNLVPSRLGSSRNPNASPIIKNNKIRNLSGGRITSFD